jgi:hypothetical protein
VRTGLLLIVVLAGCVADADEPPPVKGAAPQIEVSPIDSQDAAMDVCALASELPLDDICSLICDPPAMAARLADDGSDRGTCYQLYCSLPRDEHVLVGVCLPP